MPIIYRNIKGMPLTADELDGNFQFIEEKLDLLESNRGGIEVISKIEQEFNIIKFITNLGRTIGTVNLPIAKFKPKGEWKSGCEYEVGDLVTDGKNKVFSCKSFHKASDFVAESANWELFLSMDV